MDVSKRLPRSISPKDLDDERLARHNVLLVDVRKPPAFSADERMIAGAVRRDLDDIPALGRSLGGRVVVYCVHGHEVSQGAAATLQERGVDAHYLVGGIEGWREAGLPTRRKAGHDGTRASSWITRERPKIDRIACPWLILRFIDPTATFHYVATTDVFEQAALRGAIAYDIPGAEPFTHDGPSCSFDAFLKVFELDDAALRRLALVVRGADTDQHALAPEAAGLLALSLGLSHQFASDDHGMLAKGLGFYDALYAWACREKHERHGWAPEASANGAQR